MAASAAYTDAHRSFLQLITAKRLLTAPQVTAAYELSCSKYEVDQAATGGLQQFVISINAAISCLHLTIRKSVQEDLRADKSCFVLVNTQSTDATKTLTSLTPWEENLFEHIIEAIVLSDEGYILEVEAVNLGPSLPGNRVSLSESEAAVKRMVKNMMLNKNDDMLLLSGLTLSEQQQQLESSYPEACVKCALCKIITILGYTCDACPVRVHRVCGLKLWRQAKRNPYCPGCQAPWEYVANGRTSEGGSSQQ